MKKALISFLVITISSLMFSGLALPEKAKAAYSANNLISDAEFISSGTLDDAGVQAFLNTRGGTRLRTFQQNGQSAAQIIASAAHANGINPFVILATIQKEESLVDSNYNFDYRVNWAMGYGVCDSCSLDDPNVAQYYGFSNQINNAAWQLKRNYSYWAANGSDWNVGRTMIIDGTAVQFANRATSALYRYTPHLHGNQNFYSIYNSYKNFRWVSKTSLGKTGTTSMAKTKTAKVTPAGQGGGTYNAQLVTQSAPGVLRPGQKRTIFAYFKNTGTAAWVNTGANPVYLGSSDPQDRGSAFTGGRNVRWRMLNRSVAPGKVGVFSIEVIAPQTAGNYTEKFRPVMEGVTWFGGEVVFNFNVSGTATSSKIK